MRKILILAGSLVAVLFALAAAVLLLVDVNQYRDQIQAQMEKRLQRKVTLGTMGLRLLPLSIRIQDFSIGESPEFASSKPFLSAREIHVTVGLFALLQKRVEVNSLQLLDPSVELIKNRDGKWNYLTLGGSSQSASSQGAPAISLDDFELQNGTIAVTDHQARKPRSVYDRIDVTVKNYAPGQRFTADLRAHLPGKGKQEAALMVEGIAGGTDLDGKLSLAEVSAGPATISGDGTLSSRGNLVTGKGSLKATEARLKEPLQIDYELQYDRISGKLTAAPLAAHMGALTLTGRADAETNVTPLVFHAAIRSENAPIAELLHAANAFGVAEGVSGTGSLSLDLNAQGKGSALSYSGSVAIRTASILTSPSGKPIEIESANARLVSSAPPAGTIEAGKLAVDQIVLTQVKSNYKLDGGVLYLDPVTAGVFGGQVAGTIAMDTRAGHSSITAKTKLTKVDASQLLAATTSVKSFSGSLSGNADLKLAPPPGQEPARGLNGTVQILLTDGRMAGIQLLNEIASLGKFLGAARKPEPFTNISKLAGTLRIQDGTANTDDLQMDFDGGSMAATGTAGLADQVLNLKITTVLAKETSQSAGGSQVGGFMSTVMANSKGELVVPAIVTGTFAKPHFAPDLDRIAKMKLSNLLPTAANPAALGSNIQGMIGALTGRGQKTADPGKATPADKAKPLLDLLNSLKKQPDQKAH
jgi:AsmA protein